MANKKDPEKEAEEKIKKILKNKKFTPLQRLWLKEHKPYIYQYFDFTTYSGLLPGFDYGEKSNETYTVPDDISGHIDFFGDIYSTRKVKEISNWHLKRIKYGKGEI